MESKVLEVPETKIDVWLIQRAKMDIRIIRIIVEMCCRIFRCPTLAPVDPAPGLSDGWLRGMETCSVLVYSHNRVEKSVSQGLDVGALAVRVLLRSIQTPTPYILREDRKWKYHKYVEHWKNQQQIFLCLHSYPLYWIPYFVKRHSGCAVCVATFFCPDLIITLSCGLWKWPHCGCPEPRSPSKTLLTI